MAGNDRIIKVLNDLISTCRDSEEGYGKAAKAVRNDYVREKLTNIARERSDYAEELQRHVESLGGNPAQRPHGGGILHSGWVDLEQASRPKNDRQILIECEKGDETTVKHYEHALNQDLPREMTTTVQRQLEGVVNALDEVRELEHQPA